ncbi:Coenzyme Q-binding protein COQ10 homolog, mitochondrial-like protein [Drosera capensis]
MSPLRSILKEIGNSRLLRRDGMKQLGRFSDRVGVIDGECGLVQCSSSILGMNRRDLYRLDDVDVTGRVKGIGTAGQNIHKRWFLGCGDGDEGSALMKIHEERCVLGYSPEQLFAVVAAVDLYEDFLPWCQRSQIVRHHPDGSFDAELEIGFKYLVESYLSHVVLHKPKLIKVFEVGFLLLSMRFGPSNDVHSRGTAGYYQYALACPNKSNWTTASQSYLFEHLINIWEFNPGPTPGTCSLYFLVDFKFQSPLYRQVASMFFKEVVSRLVGSFRDRCRLIYGPAAPVLEKI